jgi:hypothetical protein
MLLCLSLCCGPIPTPYNTAFRSPATTAPPPPPPLLLLLLLQIFIATPDGRVGYTIPREPLAYSSPGRTLGVKFDVDGNLYMANSPLGLLQLVAPGEFSYAMYENLT